MNSDIPKNEFVNFFLSNIDKYKKSNIYQVNSLLYNDEDMVEISKKLTKDKYRNVDKMIENLITKLQESEINFLNIYKNQIKITNSELLEQLELLNEQLYDVLFFNQYLLNLDIIRSDDPGFFIDNVKNITIESFFDVFHIPSNIISNILSSIPNIFSKNIIDTSVIALIIFGICFNFGNQIGRFLSMFSEWVVLFKDFIVTSVMKPNLLKSKSQNIISNNQISNLLLFNKKNSNISHQETPQSLEQLRNIQDLQYQWLNPEQEYIQQELQFSSNDQYNFFDEIKKCLNTPGITTISCITTVIYKYIDYLYESVSQKSKLGYLGISLLINYEEFKKYSNWNIINEANNQNQNKNDLGEILKNILKFCKNLVTETLVPIILNNFISQGLNFIGLITKSPMWIAILGFISISITYSIFLRPLIKNVSNVLGLIMPFNQNNDSKQSKIKFNEKVNNIIKLIKKIINRFSKKSEFLEITNWFNENIYLYYQNTFSKLKTIQESKFERIPNLNTLDSNLKNTFNNNPNNLESNYLTPIKINQIEISKNIKMSKTKINKNKRKRIDTKKNKNLKKIKKIGLGYFYNIKKTILEINITEYLCDGLLFEVNKTIVENPYLKLTSLESKFDEVLKFKYNQNDYERYIFKFNNSYSREDHNIMLNYFENDFLIINVSFENNSENFNNFIRLQSNNLISIQNNNLKLIPIDTFLSTVKNVLFLEYEYRRFILEVYKIVFLNTNNLNLLNVQMKYIMFQNKSNETLLNLNPFFEINRPNDYLYQLQKIEDISEYVKTYPLLKHMEIYNNYQTEEIHLMDIVGDQLIENIIDKELGFNFTDIQIKKRILKIYRYLLEFRFSFNAFNLYFKSFWDINFLYNTKHRFKLNEINQNSEIETSESDVYYDPKKDKYNSDFYDNNLFFYYGEKCLDGYVNSIDIRVVKSNIKNLLKLQKNEIFIPYENYFINIIRKIFIYGISRKAHKYIQSVTKPTIHIRIFRIALELVDDLVRKYFVTDIFYSVGLFWRYFIFNGASINQLKKYNNEIYISFANSISNQNILDKIESKMILSNQKYFYDPNNIDGIIHKFQEKFGHFQ